MSDPATYDELKAAVVSTGNRCCAEGLQTGTGGNISCRVPGEDLMVVKASGTSFADTDLDAAVVADFHSNLVGPGRKPSKESPLHGAIYAAMPDVGAIVHVHSPWANAWCVEHDSLPAITYHAAAKLGGDLAVVDTGVSTVPDDFIPAVLRALQDPPRPVMVLRKHGLVAIGKTVDDARQMAELVEETAHVAVMSALLSRTAG